MLRDYQTEPVEKAFQILMANKIVYLNAEMRTGKTTMALHLANLVKAKSVLFVTTKKVILQESVLQDFERENFNYELTVTNYEQLHKISKSKYDVVIADEAHKFGTYPKPSLRAKMMKQIVGSSYFIMLSGTPYPETMSQLYHQFWLSDYSPFRDYKNFYSWVREFVIVRERIINGVRIREYKNAKEDEILKFVSSYFVKVTQKEAGFQNEIEEKIFEVPIDKRIYKVVDELLKHRIYEFKSGDKLVCDTAVSLQGKLHQLFSGTVKLEEKALVLDKSKAEYIKHNYLNKQIVIFYKYVAEYQAIKEVFGDEITDIPSDFNLGYKRIFVSQFQSGSQGINLSTADVIIFYNIDWSYVQYAQARERSQSLERNKTAEVHWLFSENGIERKIYKVLQKKRDYNLYYFRKDYKNED